MLGTDFLYVHKPPLSGWVDLRRVAHVFSLGPGVIPARVRFDR